MYSIRTRLNISHILLQASYYFKYSCLHLVLLFVFLIFMLIFNRRSIFLLCHMNERILSTRDRCSLVGFFAGLFCQQFFVYPSLFFHPIQKHLHRTRITHCLLFVFFVFSFYFHLLQLYTLILKNLFFFDRMP